MNRAKINKATMTKTTNHGVTKLTKFRVSFENRNNNAIDKAATNLTVLFSPSNLNLSRTANIITKINKKEKTGKKNSKKLKLSKILAI